MVAYADLAGRPLIETATRCTHATLGDVVITFWIYGIGALAANKLSWGLQHVVDKFTPEPTPISRTVPSASGTISWRISDMGFGLPKILTRCG